MELDNIFADDNGNKSRNDWRLGELSYEADKFLREMKAKGFPVNKLVSFIIEQAIPMYKPKGYTYEGYDRMKQQIRTLY
jgi:hypothetical protein